MYACLETWADGKPARTPIEYERFCIMREMHWDWQQLQDCPYEVYLDIMRYLSTEAKFHQMRAKQSG